MDFERRKDVDSTYQTIIQELSSKEAVLRAAAAVKLGAIIQSVPKEWNGDKDNRKNEIIELTKQILAAALAIEPDEKVRKTITIALVRKSVNPDTSNPQNDDYASLVRLDLSKANASNAYWARVDFSYADFFGANLEEASLRKAILRDTQFYSTNLKKAVLSGADCRGTNFKFADLRGADLSEIKLDESTNFEGAKVYGLQMKDINFDLLRDAQVDVSAGGNESSDKSFKTWFNNRNPIK